MSDASLDQLQSELRSCKDRHTLLKQEFFGVHTALRDRKAALDRLKVSRDTGTANSKYAACLEVEADIAELQQREADLNSALADAGNSIVLLQYRISTAVNK